MNASLPLASFLCFHLCCLLIWARWAKGFERGASLPRLTLYAILWHSGQLMISALALGLLGYLTPTMYFGSAAALMALPLTALLRPGLLRTGRDGSPESSATDGDREPFATDERACSWFLGVLLLITLAVPTLLGLLFSPYTTDDLWYHVPMVFFSRQTGSLAEVGMPIIDSYPRHLELWQLWILFWFGTPELIDLHQLPLLLLFIVSTYELARAFSLPRGAAAIGALTAPFAPVIFSQLSTALTDVGLSAFLLAALALLFSNRQSRFACASFGIALGLLAGTKFTGAFFAGVIFLCFCLRLLSERKSGSPFTSRLISTAVAGLLLSLHPYLTNLWRHSNPLYPYRLAFGPLELPGPFLREDMWELRMSPGQSAPERLIRSWFNVGETGYGYFSGGFGLLWPFLLLVSAVSLIAAARTKQRPLLALHGLVWLLFALTPLHFSVRFTLFLLGYGAVSFAHVIALLKTRPNIRTAALALGLLAAFACFLQSARSAALQMKGRRGTLPETCAITGFPDSYRQAFAWLAAHGEIYELTAFISHDWEISIACLWDESLGRKVSLARASSAEELTALLAPRQGSCVFLPLSSVEFKWFPTADLNVLYEDQGVIIGCL